MEIQGLAGSMISHQSNKKRTGHDIILRMKALALKLAVSPFSIGFSQILRTTAR